MNTKYPIYVISKGRSEKRPTIETLERSGAEYRVVVEPSEKDKYSSHVSEKKIIVAPEDFSKRGMGSIPVRNFVWEHSIGEGHLRHWILDDNIFGFVRLLGNQKLPIETPKMFRIIEDFVDRYSNIALAGLQYDSFIPEMQITPAFIFNTRIYSCILIKNDIPFRWRGKYNEDTDLSIRVLKARLCTILFHCFLQKKATTMTMAGGNTDTIYNSGDERLEFAKSLERQHPDCVKVIRRFGRWHHSINLRKYKTNALKRIESYNYSKSVNEQGLVCVNSNPTQEK